MVAPDESMAYWIWLAAVSTIRIIRYSKEVFAYTCRAWRGISAAIFNCDKQVYHSRKQTRFAARQKVGQTDTVIVINTAKKGGRQHNATSKQGKACGSCGRHHEIGNCAARGKLCNECGKLNHFASVCRSGKRCTGAQKDVKTAEELAEFDESDGEIYVIGEISAVTLDDSQLVTVKLESGNYLSGNKENR